MDDFQENNMVEDEEEFYPIIIKPENYNLTDEDISRLMNDMGTIYFSSELDKPSVTYLNGDEMLDGLDLGYTVEDEIPKATRSQKIEGNKLEFKKPKKKDERKEK